MIEVLDPTYKDDASSFRYAPGLENLNSATVGIISNGKKGTSHFFNAMEYLPVSYTHLTLPTILRV